MPVDAQIPYPDKWYVVTDALEWFSGSTKQEVKDDSAKYYIKESYAYHNITLVKNRYDFNEFTIYNSKVRASAFAENGVVLKQWTKEKWDGKGWGTTHVGFTIADKSGKVRDVWLSGGIGSLISCLSFMLELSKYGTWVEFDLDKKVKEQELKIAELTENNAALTTRLAEISSHKNQVQKLYFTLYQVEIKEGLQDLLNCDSITIKEIAKAFNFPAKLVRGIKKSQRE